ncbi:MAG: ABC transporter ATP-binding protein, partial [Butyrivibrio sp.]|nr:ABC transporter ATP-binding protein [Butyrivibrio sp.]
GQISFENVSFAIDDKPILEDVSFTIEKGKTLGIMGATGAGKSTIVNLLERFYDVTDGCIRIEGKDIKDMPLSDVRAFSSVVTQDVFLFSDTITENVRLGFKDSMDEVTVRNAIKSAHAKDFVEKITDSYEAVIGERGIGLSGGQKQRLSIARALAKKADLLVLDDSTSALDMETEAAIQQELLKKKDMSKIIIGHRISSVKDADEIIVLENGRVKERGTHTELIGKRGLYYSTYEAQYGDYRNALAVNE